MSLLHECAYVCVADVVLTGCTCTVVSPSYTECIDIASNTRTCTGGASITYCAIADTPPAGLVVNRVTCAITGKPTAALSVVSYPITHTPMSMGVDMSLQCLLKPYVRAFASNVYCSYTVITGISGMACTALLTCV